MFGLDKDIKQMLRLELIYPDHQLGALENCGMGLNWEGGRYKSWEGSGALL